MQHKCQGKGEAVGLPLFFSRKRLYTGRATYSMRLASYEQVPSEVQEKLLRSYTDTDKDE